MVRARRITAGWLLGGLLLAACTGGGSPTPSVSSTLVEVTPSTLAPDGALRIGLLLPETGPGANLGSSLLAGAELAIDQINRNGGVLGRMVEAVTRDEGASAATAAVGLDELLELRVDAVVGPASSRVAYEILPNAVRSGILVCSPTATAIGLTDYPDDGLLFRTVPSDALQAVALARLIEQTGKQSAAIIAPDDIFGDQFAAELERALRAIPITVTASVRYDPASVELDDVAARTLGSAPGAVAVLGSGDGGAAMLAAVRRAADGQLPVFVNDALGSPSVVEVLGENGAETVAGVRGTTVNAEPVERGTTFSDEFEATYPDLSNDFAAYAYDCVTLIALAAAAAGSDQPSAIGAAIGDASSSGDRCFTYVECAVLLATPLNVNFEGASGALDIDPNGDVRSGTYQVFVFDETGRAVVDGDPETVP